MNNNNKLLTLTVALAIALVGGLVVVPAAEQIGLLQQAQADKGGVPNTHAAGHGKGRGVCDSCGT